MKSPIQFIQKCKICDKPCDPKQTTQTNPLCPEHEEEHRQREIFMSAGRGMDPETADPEMESMVTRDLNEDEGDK